MTKLTITFSDAKLRSMSLSGFDQYMHSVGQELSKFGVNAVYEGNQWSMTGTDKAAMSVGSNPDGSVTFTIETPDGLPPADANTDTARLDWLLPIITGEDTLLANTRTVLMAKAIFQNLTGREAVDSAMLAE